ncbi:type II toxin-antitoxin system HicA family toxin [Paenibacillus taichungensis]|uniref:type II toxin-antitoxin system HicA family toxin n=1 Tax=Paenibacillus TaxID=44249 RepID=UPI0022A98E8C|nr:type II toxin-antitoxin system HicA family toxin [Paenibacillus tundrae]MCZ1265964.1 type II toxin-antitoxin system HicA family toxin [Paenibacillus tundrae]
MKIDPKCILQNKEGITFSELEKLLKEWGFEEVRTAGRHHLYKHSQSSAIITLPNELNVKPIYLKTIIRIMEENGFLLDAE